jgi:hypothetical protein
MLGYLVLLLDAAGVEVDRIYLPYGYSDGIVTDTSIYQGLSGFIGISYPGSVNTTEPVASISVSRYDQVNTPIVNPN